MTIMTMLGLLAKGFWQTLLIFLLTLLFSQPLGLIKTPAMIPAKKIIGPGFHLMPLFVY